MKKVLFGLVALSTVALATETNLYLRVGADLNGKYQTMTVYEEDMSTEKADEFSYEFAVEATRNLTDNLEFGLGVAYQKHGAPNGTREYDDFYNAQGKIEHYKAEYDMKGYTSIPLYLTLKYNFNAINNFVPYIKGNLGYSFNEEDGDITYTESNLTQKTSEGYKFGVDMNNGLYYGIGAGFEYNNFTIDLMYQVNEATAKLTDKDPGYEYRTIEQDCNYSRLTLSFGYKFNF